MMWQWEYSVTFSCDNSWKMGGEHLTEEEAKKQACDFVSEGAKYDRAILVRWNKMELCERCKHLVGR